MCYKKKKSFLTINLILGNQNLDYFLIQTFFLYKQKFKSILPHSITGFKKKWNKTYLKTIFKVVTSLLIKLEKQELAGEKKTKKQKQYTLK